MDQIRNRPLLENETYSLDLHRGIPQKREYFVKQTYFKYTSTQGVNIHTPSKKVHSHPKTKPWYFNFSQSILKGKNKKAWMTGLTILAVIALIACFTGVGMIAGLPILLLIGIKTGFITTLIVGVSTAAMSSIVLGNSVGLLTSLYEISSKIPSTENIKNENLKIGRLKHQTKDRESKLGNSCYRYTFINMLRNMNLSWMEKPFSSRSNQVDEEKNTTEYDKNERKKVEHFRKKTKKALTHWIEGRQTDRYVILKRINAEINQALENPLNPKTNKEEQDRSYYEAYLIDTNGTSFLLGDHIDWSKRVLDASGFPGFYFKQTMTKNGKIESAKNTPSEMILTLPMHNKGNIEEAIRKYTEPEDAPAREDELEGTVKTKTLKFAHLPPTLLINPTRAKEYNSLEQKDEEYDLNKVSNHEINVLDDIEITDKNNKKGIYTPLSWSVLFELPFPRRDVAHYISVKRIENKFYIFNDYAYKGKPVEFNLNAPITEDVIQNVLGVGRERINRFLSLNNVTLEKTTICDFIKTNTVLVHYENKGRRNWD